MRIAVTGGTGFVGSHLFEAFDAGDHEFVLLARGVEERTADLKAREDVRFVTGSVADVESLREAFEGCAVVVHLAGINHERGDQTYDAVHVEGTRNVVRAAEETAVSKIVLTSYLRARPDSGCGYHDSKWAAETIVRRSSLEHSILKPGVIYGPGDQLLCSIGRALSTAPIFPTIGFESRRIRPVAIADVVDVLAAATVDDRLADSTVAVVGPEELTITELVERVGESIGRAPVFVPTPRRLLYGMALVQTWVFETPLITPAGVRMLTEEATDPEPEGVCDPLPADLDPTRSLSLQRIESGLGDIQRIGFADLRT